MMTALALVLVVVIAVFIVRREKAPFPPGLGERLGALRQLQSAGMFDPGSRGLRVKKGTGKRLTPKEKAKLKKQPKAKPLKKRPKREPKQKKVVAAAVVAVVVVAAITTIASWFTKPLPGSNSKISKLQRFMKPNHKSSSWN